MVVWSGVVTYSKLQSQQRSYHLQTLLCWCTQKRCSRSRRWCWSSRRNKPWQGKVMIGQLWLIITSLGNWTIENREYISEKFKRKLEKIIAWLLLLLPSLPWCCVEFSNPRTLLNNRATPKIGTFGLILSSALTDFQKGWAALLQLPCVFVDQIRQPSYTKYAWKNMHYNRSDKYQRNYNFPAGQLLMSMIPCMSFTYTLYSID